MMNFNVQVAIRSVIGGHLHPVELVAALGLVQVAIRSVIGGHDYATKHCASPGVQVAIRFVIGGHCRNVHLAARTSSFRWPSNRGSADMIEESSRSIYILRSSGGHRIGDRLTCTERRNLVLGPAVQVAIGPVIGGHR